MAYLIGTDEAGYGPNLGPLVISATVWRVPDAMGRQDLYELLRDVVSTNACADPACVHWAIADSKLLYKPGGGLRQLERGVLTALSLTGTRAGSWRSLWRALYPRCDEYLDVIPWYAAYDAKSPCAATEEELERLAEHVARGLERACVQCCRVRSVAVFPERFNQLVEEHGTKGAALSQLTLDLVHEMLETLGDEPVVVNCDKHGGRNKYGPLLQQRFPEYLVEIHREGRAESVYRWGPARRRIEVRFVAGGESFLPSALASMTAKYLRELALQALNGFWASHVPDLRPTAGYPTDARRFKAAIADAQQRLRIDDRLLWRAR